MVWGDATEHDLVAEFVCRGVYAVDEFGVEVLSCSECHTEQLGAQLTQPSCPRIGPVADFVGGTAYPGARLVAGAGGIAHDDGHQGPGDARVPGDILQCRTMLHDVRLEGSSAPCFTDGD